MPDAQRFFQQQLAAAQQAQQQQAQQQKQQAQTSSGEIIEIDDWLVEFVNLFRETTGIDSDRYGVCMQVCVGASTTLYNLHSMKTIWQQVESSRLCRRRCSHVYPKQGMTQLLVLPSPACKPLLHLLSCASKGLETDLDSSGVVCLSSATDRHIDYTNEGMSTLSRAMDATLRSDAAEPLFDKAIDRFKEVIASGYLNWAQVCARTRYRSTCTSPHSWLCCSCR